MKRNAENSCDLKDILSLFDGTGVHDFYRWLSSVGISLGHAIRACGFDLMIHSRYATDHPCHQTDSEKKMTKFSKENNPAHSAPSNVSLFLTTAFHWGRSDGADWKKNLSIVAD